MTYLVGLTRDPTRIPTPLLQSNFTSRTLNLAVRTTSAGCTQTSLKLGACWGRRELVSQSVSQSSALFVMSVPSEPSCRVKQGWANI